MIKCTLCAAVADTPPGRSAQQQGWTQLQIAAPAGNRYLAVCPTHPGAEVVSWVKSALAPGKKA